MNFDSPYRSYSVGEFWKRWHITLTSFFREWRVLSLGRQPPGNGTDLLQHFPHLSFKRPVARGGWTFVVWGALHGLGQVVERLWGRRDRLPGTVRWGITFLFVNLALGLFPGAGSHRGVLAAVCGNQRRRRAPGAWLLEGLLSSEMEAAQLLVPQPEGRSTPWLPEHCTPWGCWPCCCRATPSAGWRPSAPQPGGAWCWQGWPGGACCPSPASPHLSIPTFKEGPG